MKTVRIGVVLAMLLAACSSQAQDGKRISRECRQEIVTLCGMTFDRRKMAECLRGKVDMLSDGCRKELVARAVRKAEPVAGQREFSFGADPKQRLDFVPANGADRRAPIIVYIHGGGWSIGDKGYGGSEKATYFTGRGFAYATLNYRLVPAVTVEQQGADVASALAYLRANATTLGVDPDRIVLMGHSAGAHLAALVATDPAYLNTARVPMAAVRGVILLDGAAYDVTRQVADGRNRLPEMYQAAFGTDPKRQAALSPTMQAGGPNAADWLILPVAARADSTKQSQALAAALRKGGSQATVTPVPDSSHMLINRNLGTAGDFATAQVDAFTQRVLR